MKEVLVISIALTIMVLAIKGLSKLFDRLDK